MVEHTYNVYTKAEPVAAMETFTGGLAVNE
jgi:hypothetical protein